MSRKNYKKQQQIKKNQKQVEKKLVFDRPFLIFQVVTCVLFIYYTIAGGLGFLNSTDFLYIFNEIFALIIIPLCLIASVVYTYMKKVNILQMLIYPIVILTCCLICNGYVYRYNYETEQVLIIIVFIIYFLEYLLFYNKDSSRELSTLLLITSLIITLIMEKILLIDSNGKWYFKTIIAIVLVSLQIVPHIIFLRKQRTLDKTFIICTLINVGLQYFFFAGMYIVKLLS